MVKPKRTTIEITNAARESYERLTARYGIKTTISAGIMLLDKLPPDKREKAIDEAADLAISAKPSNKESVQSAIQMLKEMVEVERQQPGTVYRVLTREEQVILDDFRKAFTSESGQKTRKKA